MDLTGESVLWTEDGYEARVRPLDEFRTSIRVTRHGEPMAVSLGAARKLCEVMIEMDCGADAN